MIKDILPQVDATNLDTAIELAGAVQEVRGYGPVKHAAFEQYEVVRARLLETFRKGGSAQTQPRALASQDN